MDHFNKSSYIVPSIDCVIIIMTVHYLDRLSSTFLGIKDVVYKLQPYTWGIISFTACSSELRPVSTRKMTKNSASKINKKVAFNKVWRDGLRCKFQHVKVNTLSFIFDKKNVENWSRNKNTMGNVGGGFLPKLLL